MDLELVLNDLSLRVPAVDRRTAQQRMADLVDTLRVAVSSGANRVLRVHDSFQQPQNSTYKADLRDLQ